MKRGYFVFVFAFLLIPIVSAVPAAPYSILSEDGSWVPVSVDEDGNSIGPLYSQDEDGYNIPDEDLGWAVFEQQGDHDYSEVYEKQTQCPIVFEKDTITGRDKPYFGKITSDGYIESDTSLEFTPDLRVEDVEQEGIVCGYQDIQDVRPWRPSAEGRQLYDMYNYERIYSNAQYGYGVKILQDGSSTYYNSYLQKQQSDGKIAPPPKNEPKPILIFTGQVIYDLGYEQKELTALVIPVQFSDVKAKLDTDDLEENFFGEENSLARYYFEQSYGALKISGAVLPQWYTLEETMDYYGDNYEARVEDMIVEAIYAADADVDFSQYDYNGDGIVDGLFVVHAGEPDENGGGNNEEIWSHYFSINPVSVDGVQIIDYETVSEESPIGIVAHEFGHYLGLPDLYDTVTDDGSSKGTAEWSLMGYGGYMDPPGSFDPWSKGYLGWLNEYNYQEIESNDYYTLVEDLSSSGTKYYALFLSLTEIFFLENRHEDVLLNGDDAGGVLIWHVDEAVMEDVGSWNGCSGTKWDCNTVNGDADHKFIDVEEASGEQNIDDGDLAEAEDAWFENCGAFGACQQNEFFESSSPQAVSYDGTRKIYVGVYSGIGGIMELGVTVDGSLLAAPEETSVSSSEGSTETFSVSSPEEKNSFSIVTLVIIGISVLLIFGGCFVAWRLLRKREVDWF